MGFRVWVSGLGPLREKDDTVLEFILGHPFMEAFTWAKLYASVRISHTEQFGCPAVALPGCQRI